MIGRQLAIVLVFLPVFGLTGVEGRLLLFVVLNEGADLDAVRARLKTSLRSQLSPRHVPDEIHQVAVIPTTQPGTYYILVRGHSEPSPNTPATILARLVPLSITSLLPIVMFPMLTTRASAFRTRPGIAR